MTTDKIRYYVGGIIALANGSRKLDVAKARAMQLFRDADIRQREHLSVAQKVRDQLSEELNRHHGAAQQFIGEVLEWLDREQLGRGGGTDAAAQRHPSTR